MNRHVARLGPVRGYLRRVRSIDLRSDTVTRPTPGMREAMAKAEVGDDVYGEDPSVNSVQERVAALLGKQAALFFPSGTMANQAALRIHTRPGDVVIAARDAHILKYECSGSQRMPPSRARPASAAFC